MFNDKSRRESLYHCALILSKDNPKLKKIGISRKSNKHLRNLLETYGNLENTFYAHKPKDMFGQFADPITQFPGFETIMKRLDQTSFNFGTITIKDKEYPETLKKYDDSPPVLYYRGDLELLKRPSMVVIGTRKLEEQKDIIHGKSVLERLIYGEKAKFNTEGTGYCIVSGLAKGCDTLAHKTAIKDHGSTIAVIGTALDRYFPAENQTLQEYISTNHLVLSQYPIGFNPFKGTGFVERNYTVSCLSTHGVVVIRASDSSGTLHAVRHCIDQEKPLYVLENNMCQDYNWIKTHKNKINVIKNQMSGKID
ncbi:DNA-protecting protein DprA [archaeon]|nr:DNA-protecting protein DprA [archaeon]MBT6868835.1 DNA-protecting protein DprA [archaeon]MBT7192944.1 DNA-protecting protein DprA [archaeon]MBT7380910.1 DNA-protecting protein DprA [archaeon]MBT7507665.1 DNA-protecting protein DprA [archaeon]